jgi:hypothetical protein
VDPLQLGARDLAGCEELVRADLSTCEEELPRSLGPEAVEAVQVGVLHRGELR